MRHEAGLAAFTVSLDPKDLLTDNIKQNKIGEIIENQPLRYPEDGTGKREYHTFTRGWIANEVFRRVDPEGRTIGEWVRQELCTPLEIACFIGLKGEELDRRELGVEVGLGQMLLESLKPKGADKKIEFSFFGFCRKFMKLMPFFRKVAAIKPTAFTDMHGLAVFNEDRVAKCETPSANTHSNARSLAKLASVMATGGSFGATRILGDAGWQALHSNETSAIMGISQVVFTQGGVSAFHAHQPDFDEFQTAFNVGREGFFGWTGYGGSVFQWHPEHQIGFGYVPTSLFGFDILNERAKAYQAEVLKCVRAMG